jgi:hypothetical protein
VASVLITYNQIIDSIEEVTNHHLQINQFKEGHVSQIVEDSSAFTYPLCFVQDNPHTVQDKSMYYNLTLFFCDLVKEDRTNERDVKSDMGLIALDFIAILNDLSFVGESTTAYLDKEQTIRIEPFTESFSDRIAGVKMDVRIKQPYEWNRCFAPTSGNTTCT